MLVLLTQTILDPFDLSANVINMVRSLPACVFALAFMYNFSCLHPSELFLKQLLKGLSTQRALAAFKTELKSS